MRGSQIARSVPLELRNLTYYDAYDQWVLRQLGAFAGAVGVADAAEQLAVARYLQAHSHGNILLRWVSKNSDTPRASILLRAIGKARSEPGCLALRGQQPPGGEPGGVGGEAGGGGGGDHDHDIGGGNDDNISTTPLWAAPCAPALPRALPRRPSLAPTASVKGQIYHGSRGIQP